MHCREHVVQLHQRIDDLHATGGEIYVIGNGTPNFIEGFRETTGWRGPLYTDPSLEVYKAAGMKRSVLKTVGLGGLVRSVGTLRRGFKQGRVQGDAWQQGGVLVISTTGDVLWSQESGGPGDNASADQIIAGLRARAS
jgi:hypothetical protein